jgi:hypothetical protein
MAIVLDGTGSITGLTSGAGIAAAALSGQVPDANAPSGSVIQVVQSVRTSLLSTTSSSYQTILSATITPASASSKFLIMCTGQEGTDAGDGNSYSQHLLQRGSTDIYLGDASGSAGRGSAGRFGRQGDSSSDAVSFMYVDSPNTTSPVTYNWLFRSPRGPSWRVFIGGSIRNSFSADIRVPTNMIIMEIAA